MNGGTTVALSDDFAQLIASKPGPQCPIARLLADLPDDDSAALAAALARPKHELPSVDIHRVMVKNGHEVRLVAYQIHRRGGCGCPKGNA